MEELLSVETVAKRFGWSPSKLYRLIGLGLFPHGKDVGGSPMWVEADLVAYILLAGRWKPQPVKIPKRKKGEPADDVEK